MTEDGSGQDPFGEDPRLDRISDRLKDIEQKDQAGRREKRGHVDTNYRLGNRVLADLIGGIVGGLLFGWLFDLWLGTSPWLLLAFLFLGIIVAFRNIIKVSNAHSAANGPEPADPQDKQQD